MKRKVKRQAALTPLDFRIDGPAAPAPRLVLAHGAGAPMDSPFMNEVAKGLAGQGVEVVRFEFPYMQRRRREGVRAGPGPLPALCAHFERVLSELSPSSCSFIGGKSMGGRLASMIVDATDAAGLVCLGYPFHPEGRPERTRTAHLAQLRTPTLIVQGTRDALGSRDDVAGYVLSPAISIVWIEDGDHSFVPRRRAGSSPHAAMTRAVDAVASFIHARSALLRRTSGTGS